MKYEEEIGRYELKYVVRSELRDQIVELVTEHAVPDPHAQPMDNGRTGYSVHSLYFDTSDLQDYFERLDERRVRNRLRIRTYGRPGECQPVFLENKRKSGRWVVKHRVCACDTDTWLCTDDAHSWRNLPRRKSISNHFAGVSFNKLVNGSYRKPTIVVHYEREVFLQSGYDHNKARLTIDHDVRARRATTTHDLFQEAEASIIPPDWLVLELKFQRFAPAWMLALRQALGIHAVPVSKFGLSMATILRRHRPQELRALTPPPLWSERGRS